MCPCSASSPMLWCCLLALVWWHSWWALHNAESATHGVDMEQPGSQRNNGARFFGQQNLEWVHADVDAQGSHSACTRHCTRALFSL